MKRPSFLGGPCHPWLFIEEASNREVEKDFNSVYSRLVLCKTYRLDEDGKVLTPEEVLQIITRVTLLVFYKRSVNNKSLYFSVIISLRSIYKFNT